MKKRKLLTGCLALTACALCASATLALNAPAIASANGISDATFEMEEGGSVRLTSNNEFGTGLRFRVKMSEDIKTSASKIGMYIFPADYLEDDGTDGDIHYESYKDISAANKLDIEFSKLYQEDGYWWGNGAITDIKTDNISRDFIGVAYYVYNGETVYPTNLDLTKTTRSVETVAEAAYNDATCDYGKTHRETLAGFLGNTDTLDKEYGGFGTETQPYLIYDQADFDYFTSKIAEGVTYADTYFKLADKVTGSLTASSVIGTSTNAFAGTLDGNGKTVRLDMTSSTYTGLFAGAASTLKNTVLTGTISDCAYETTVDADGNATTDIDQKNGSHDYFFGEGLSTNYYLKAKVTTGAILNNDSFPKFGLLNKSGDVSLHYYLDIAGERVNSCGRVKNMDWNTSSYTFGESWALGYNDYNDLADLITYGEEATLELVRYGQVFALKVNGKTVLSDSNISGMTDGSAAGLFFFNTEAKITVEAFTTTETEVASHIAMPDKNIDGDLSDWDLTATQLASETASENNGNQMTVYAYAGTNGLHIAYDVTHCYKPDTTYAWGSWWLNVNAEFWIGHEHFAVTQTGSSGLMNAVLKTTEKADGKFQTIAEIFVPYDVLDNSDNVYDLGIAFKACGESTGDAVNFNGSSWWYFTNHFPTDMSVRYTITKS